MPDNEKQLLERIAVLQGQLSRLGSVNAYQETGNFSGEILERFLAGNSLAMFRASVEGELFEANESFVKLLGYSLNEIEEGKVLWKEITAPEYAEADSKAVAELTAKGKANVYEKEFIHKDGHRVPVLISTSASDSEAKDCLCLLADLTEQKSREAELERNEAIFRALTETVPQMIFVVAAGGTVEYFNQHWSESTGIERTPGHLERWIETIHPEDLGLLQKWDEAVATGSPLESEVRYKTASGDYHWSIVRALPQKDEAGKILKWFGTCTDIDEQKKAEEKIRESEAHFRTLADSIPQIVWTADPTGNIDFFNHRWTEYTGLSVEQSLAGAWKLLIHPDDLDKYLDDWNTALKTGDTYEATFRLQRALGIKNETGRPYRRHLVRAVALHGRNKDIIKWFATWTEIEHASNAELE